MFELDEKKSIIIIIVSIIIMIIIIILSLYFFRNYKEKFNTISPEYQAQLDLLYAPQPTENEQIVIDYIVNDLEMCFNNKKAKPLLSENYMKLLNDEFINKWKINIHDGFKKKIIELMREYYKNIVQNIDKSVNNDNNYLKTLPNIYCDESTKYENQFNKIKSTDINQKERDIQILKMKSYSNFKSLYDSELNKIVDNIECLILKIYKYPPYDNIIIKSIDKKELFYQIQCIHQYIFNGLGNPFNDLNQFYF